MFGMIYLQCVVTERCVTMGTGLLYIRDMFHRPVIMNALIFEFVKSREFLDRLSVCRISRGTERHVVSYFSSRLISYLVN